MTNRMKKIKADNIELLVNCFLLLGVIFWEYQDFHFSWQATVWICAMCAFNTSMCLLYLNLKDWGFRFGGFLRERCNQRGFLIVIVSIASFLILDFNLKLAALIMSGCALVVLLIMDIINTLWHKIFK